MYDDQYGHILAVKTLTRDVRYILEKCNAWNTWGIMKSQQPSHEDDMI